MRQVVIWFSYLQDMLHWNSCDSFVVTNKTCKLETFLKYIMFLSNHKIDAMFSPGEVADADNVDCLACDEGCKQCKRSK